MDLLPPTAPSLVLARETCRPYRTPKDGQVFLNEDLTAKRAMFAFKTRQLKREKKIADYWTHAGRVHAGRVLIKTLNGKITEILIEKDLVYWV